MDGNTVDFGGSVRTILAGAAQDEKWNELLTALGVENTMLNAIHLALCLKALGGDVQAAKYLRDTAEEGGGAEESAALWDFSVLSDRELRALAVEKLRKAGEGSEA